jgi:hypothetical protein
LWLEAKAALECRKKQKKEAKAALALQKAEERLLVECLKKQEQDARRCKAITQYGTRCQRARARAASSEVCSKCKALGRCGESAFD